MAHDHYERVPHYRDLTPQDEQALLERHMNRVTDTCIPEEEAMRRIEKAMLEEWIGGRQDAASGYFPHEFMYRILLERQARSSTTRSIRRTRWMLAAAREEPADVRARVGGLHARQHVRRRTASSGDVKNVHTVRTRHRVHDDAGRLVHRRRRVRRIDSIGFFQIGGGIAGDFPICVVPMLHQDLQRDDVPLWGYFCQISDSTTSYGSYSGAVPNEKITWGKLGIDTPKFIIESDATIVAPLIFALVLGQ